MVKIGDKIKVNNIMGKIVSISQYDDGRYLIIYRNNKGEPSFFLEGDEQFEVIKNEWM